MTNRYKNTFGLLFSLLLPLVILFLAESGLRWGGYGIDLDHLFLTTPDGQYLYMNKEISKRYFTASQATTGNIEFFKKKKDANTIRMFVLGESAALGFPYPNNISFQRMLKYELQKNNPSKNIEIINLSLTAINSYTFYDFGKELAKYEPDAILIYGGHNEYYGALGVGSTNTFGNNPTTVRMIIRLRQTRLVQLLEQITHSFRSRSIDKESDNLMKYVVKNQLIKYQSPLFYKGIDQFRRNMEDLMSVFHEENIPVFCSTVGTNLKDQYPFRSILSEKTDSTFYREQLQAARLSVGQGEITTADSILTLLYNQDPAYADCSYLLGKVKLTLGEKEQAYSYFNDAKQKDGLRFRAPDEINETIDRLAGTFNNTHKVDAEAAFKAESPDHIPGYKLLLEHVHPTIEGHRLIAKCFLRELNGAGFFREKKMNEYVVTGESLSTFPVLEFDSLAGAYSCARLKQGFPFFETGNDTIQAETPVEKMAMQYVREKNWYKSMETLYKYAVSVKDYPLALDLMRVRILDNEYDPAFYSSAGDICTVMHRYEEALEHYRKSFALHNSFPCAKEIISVALRLDKPETAVQYMEYAIANNQSAMNFRTLKNHCIEIIRYKKLLETTPSDEIYRKIREIYLQIGNTEAAALYPDRKLTR